MGQSPAVSLPTLGFFLSSGRGGRGGRWDVAEAPSSGGPSHYGWTRPPENGPGGGPFLENWPGSSLKQEKLLALPLHSIKNGPAAAN